MMLSILRLILGPVLLWQGARVRRDILRLPEPSGHRSGQAGSGPALSVLLLGDSSIAGVGAETQQEALSGKLSQLVGQTHQVSWIMRGKTGWTTADALESIPDIAAGQTDVIVIALGVNDVTTETGIPTWLKTYSLLIQQLGARFKPRLIVISGLPEMGAFPALPWPLSWYMGMQAKAHETALFQHFEAEPLVRILPLQFDLDASAMAEDGFHPGPQVYEDWAVQIADLIMSELPETPAG